jgi:hypothetical protein
MVAACLAALSGDRYRDAALTLRPWPKERLVEGGLEAKRERGPGRGKPPRRSARRPA